MYVAVMTGLKFGVSEVVLRVPRVFAFSCGGVDGFGLLVIGVAILRVWNSLASSRNMHIRSPSVSMELSSQYRISPSLFPGLALIPWCDIRDRWFVSVGSTVVLSMFE